ncbi:MULTISPECIES: hypothetical protein [Parachlamydia]|uniref:hypothetical protein n=1 Tax=Parachlamydia TaxID=83551 RepID=UPI0001C17C7D|nr:hypothetical protein [Parachlamydia acanthamoebae]EFB42345.1 hypothetical protein pah_c010o040 [Parachlamydia acanthamoebae str. Hall's coccus]
MNSLCSASTYINETKIPSEIWEEIFKFAGLKGTINMGKTRRAFYEIANDLPLKVEVLATQFFYY